MVETLVQRIRTIKDIPPYISVDKDKEMREEFEEWRAKNKVVNAVMGGDTTFSQEYQKAFGNYTTGKVFKPYTLPESFKEKIADLEACIGNSGLNDSMYTKALMNPLGSGFVYGGLGLAAAGAVVRIDKTKKQQVTDRRTFLKNAILLVATPVTLGSVGVYFGWGVATGIHRNLELLKKDAIYLDNLYTRLYKK